MMKGILFTIFTMMSSPLIGQDLYSEIVNSEDHSIFLELVEFIGLDSLLLDDGYHSVFVPNNNAFESRYDLDEWDSLKINDPVFLESLLLNHFVSDTVIVEPISDTYLPLSGSHFYLFVDGAGSIGFNSLNSPSGEPYPYLSGTFLTDNVYSDLNNGRIFWMQNNIVHPNCQPTSELNLNVVGPLANILIQSNWIDTIWNTTTPMTFLCPRSNEVYEYIDQNGGISNTSFVDSFVRRHIINEYMPLQGIDDVSIVQNLLGEELVFSKQDNQYYLNESYEIVHFYDYKKSASITIDNFLTESNISATESTFLDQFDISPNPASNVITVSNSGRSNKSTLKIFSVDGNFVRHGEYSGSKFNVFIDDLKPGFYILEFRNDINFERTTLLVL